MSSAYITVGLQEINTLDRTRALRALTQSDRLEVLGSIGAELESQTQQRFDTKIDPDGNRWKDIEKSTKAYYLKRFNTSNPGSGVLYRSGDLHDTIESQASDWSVLVGATKIYAAVHQFGWEEKNIASRAYLGISSGDKADLEKIADDYLAKRCAS